MGRWHTARQLYRLGTGGGSAVTAASVLRKLALRGERKRRAGIASKARRGRP